MIRLQQMPQLRIQRFVEKIDPSVFLKSSFSHEEMNANIFSEKKSFFDKSAFDSQGQKLKK